VGNRTILTVAGLATVFFVSTLNGQSPGVPGYLPARSNTAGFSIGLFLNGTAASYEDDSTVESGGGLALRLGYGFNPSLELFAEFTGASVQHDGLSETYGVGHFDVGLRYNIGKPAGATRPYAFGAVSGLGIDVDMLDVEMRGTGFTVGGGLRYFFNPAFALDVDLCITFANLDEGRLAGGSWQDLGDEAVSMTSSRFNAGVSWHRRR